MRFWRGDCVEVLNNLHYYIVSKHSQRFRCNHSPLAGESQSQLVGDAERGQKSLDNQGFRAEVKILKNIFLT